MSKIPTTQPAPDQQLRAVADGLWVVDHPMVLGGGFQLPTRMTVMTLGEADDLLAYSPVPLSEATAQAIEAQGTLRWLIAPNLFHHFYVGGVQQRFSEARTLGALGLTAKRADLHFDGELAAEGTEPFADGPGGSLQRVFVDGAPSMNESVLFHPPSSALVVADLMFNMVRPQGLTANVGLRLMGVHGKLGQSRAWRLFFSKDRAALRASCEQIVALPFERVVPCHGDVFEPAATDEAQQAVGEALRWMLGR